MRNRGGFTIVETMIVLGITAIIFVAVIGSITQRQNRIQFSQGMRDINSMINDVFNDVSDGYYPTVLGLTCSAGSDNAAPKFSHDGTSNDTTGLKKDCVFAGKVIQLGTDSDAGSGYVYSMAGRRQFYVGVTPQDVSAFSELKPAVIDPLNTDNIISSPTISKINATTTLKLPYGIKVIDKLGNDAGRAAGVFYKDFRGTSLSGQQNSGVTSVSIVPVTSGLSALMTQTNVINAADNIATANFLTSSTTTVFCFKSGSTSETATITIGPGIQGSTQLDYDVDLSGVSCA